VKKTLYRWLDRLRRLNPLRSRVTVGARAVVLDGDRVLLVRHSYIDGWYLPGGGVERRESYQAAVCRELVEEVGVTAEAPRLFGVYLAEGPGGRDDYVALFVVDRFVRRAGQARDPEIAEAAFFPLAGLPVGADGAPLVSPATRRRLAEIQGGLPQSDRW
jgi:ADP-ribose pyrophosphatase YjhB (NUDIX family)